ncbi:hypothetical protein GJV85_06730 [Sulfurimonas aquatica]|uniref:Uncharacterized protein n=1 Tax=Sulfurimonas aquatica TaxID=2672570 RepID=A0A975GCZ2_9BACT|nr:hypothetical protein [Sulfurimonas aquatica]QSZ41813.1 hypothetical protein GJV85_06730 [Sulfurimonas aquatica]
MNMNPYLETINLVKSLNGRYKQEDKEMVVKIIDEYKKKHNCSYKYAYEMNVEGNPSYSAYSSWRHKLKTK